MLEKETKYSKSEVIPVPKELILKLVNLLGMNSMYTCKKTEELLSNNLHKILKHGRENISLGMFRLMLKEVEAEIKYRENINFCDHKYSEYADAMFGQPIGEIQTIQAADLQKSCDSYEAENSKYSQQTVSCVKKEFNTRIKEARSILNYLKKLAPEGIMYDRVNKITRENYEGLVFGLMVPGLQNYIGGYGACGIHHNTFVLSEAQVDRFLFKIKVGYPKFEHEIDIVNRYTEMNPEDIKLRKIFDKNDLLHLQGLVRQIPVANDIKKYAVDLVSNTRNKKDIIEYGASPRASISLIMAAKARALMNGRKYVSKEDVNVMALPVLRHRIILSFEAERQNLDEDDVIKSMIKK